MDFIVRARDGPGRTGELTVDHKKVITPNVLFVDTNRFKAPDFADILLTNENLKTEKPSLKVFEGMFSSSTRDHKGELQVSNYLFYPKDLPKELHLSSLKLYKKGKPNCYIIPGNIEIVDDALKDNDASLFIVANATQLFQQPKKFVDLIVHLREKIGYQRMVYLPSTGDPASFALLTYMGVDLFDSTLAIIAARNNCLMFPTGQFNINELAELPCSCPICSDFQGEPSEMDFQQILQHNYFAIINEIKHVRNTIKNGCLRELVETRIRIGPVLTAILRNLDMSHYEFLERRTPVTSKSHILANTKEAMNRPEIKRFQMRLINRYKKPKSTRILLLLPCSAKKPYSFSKSHKLFKETIGNSGNPFVIHEVIVTSPLGIVPRELELVYPASSYDIPVTGVWDEDEKRMIRELLKRYLEINKYDKIIAHLPNALSHFIEELLEKPITTCVDSPTSKASLEQLSNVLLATVGPYGKINPRSRFREDLEALAAYQFGGKIAGKLLKNTTIRGKYPYQKIIHENRQLGMITKERGLISLTLEGAKKLSDSGMYWVEIYDDFTLKGSVFAPGVKDADDLIRIGDDVVVLKNKKLCAVGVAQMNGEEMKNSSHGEAVKTRHIT